MLLSLKLTKRPAMKQGFYCIAVCTVKLSFLVIYYAKILPQEVDAQKSDRNAEVFTLRSSGTCGLPAEVAF